MRDTQIRPSRPNGRPARERQVNGHSDVGGLEADQYRRLGVGTEGDAAVAVLTHRDPLLEHHLDHGAVGVRVDGGPLLPRTVLADLDVLRGQLGVGVVGGHARRTAVHGLLGLGCTRRRLRRSRGLVAHVLRSRRALVGDGGRGTVVGRRGGAGAGLRALRVILGEGRECEQQEHQEHGQAATDHSDERQLGAGDEPALDRRPPPEELVELLTAALVGGGHRFVTGARETLRVQQPDRREDEQQDERDDQEERDPAEERDVEQHDLEDREVHDRRKQPEPLARDLRVDVRAVLGALDRTQPADGRDDQKEMRDTRQEHGSGRELEDLHDGSAPQVVVVVVVGAIDGLVVGGTRAVG